MSRATRLASPALSALIPSRALHWALRRAETRAGAARTVSEMLAGGGGAGVGAAIAKSGAVLTLVGAVAGTSGVIFNHTSSHHRRYDHACRSLVPRPNTIALRAGEWRARNWPRHPRSAAPLAPAAARTSSVHRRGPSRLKRRFHERGRRRLSRWLGRRLIHELERRTRWRIPCWSHDCELEGWVEREQFPRVERRPGRRIERLERLERQLDLDHLRIWRRHERRGPGPSSGTQLSAVQMTSDGGSGSDGGSPSSSGCGEPTTTSSH
jgi:hypothetical protein